MSDKALFDAVRAIKGKALTQADVDLINRALMRDVATAAGGMRISQRGIDLILGFETLRLTAYKDPGSRNGLPITNGWGSTTDLQGQPIELGAVWTRDYADAVFARDLAAFETGVNLLLDGKPTTQAQFDALVSFAYNVGLDIDDDTIAEGLGDSTLLKKHLAGDYAGAQAAFASWRYNDGKVMNGLVRRRAAEAALYGSGR
mgnify:CR=1 FL=1